MNIIHLAGHLGDDPEERFTPSGQKVINLRVAVHSRRRGEDTTTWYRVTIWGDRFDKMLPYLKKGSAVIVIGDLHKPEVYTDREGKAQVSLEVTAEAIRFSPFGRSERGQQGATQPQAANLVFAQPTPGGAPMPQTTQEVMGSAATLDDNLPF
jgi:single-strand DNA-binding protein